MKHIFVIDDDLHIGNLLEELLTREGYQVSRAYSGTEALLLLSRPDNPQAAAGFPQSSTGFPQASTGFPQAAAGFPQTTTGFPQAAAGFPQATTGFRPDLVLLDLMLPGLNGEELLPLLKDIPVIILSAKADADHKAELLFDGASDYITKPFHAKELLARIAVQLRNSTRQAPASRLSFGDLTLNTETHMAQVCGLELKLTRTEYAILKILMLNPTQVITKSLLLDRISPDTPDCTEGSLKMHVSNLRRKLREKSNKDYIEAVWGIGFRLREEEPPH